MFQGKIRCEFGCICKKEAEFKVTICENVVRMYCADHANYTKDNIAPDVVLEAI